MPPASRRGRGGRGARSTDARRDPTSRINSHSASAHHSLVSIQFNNWKGSKLAATEEDGGYQAFLNFLERRAKIGQDKTQQTTAGTRPPRIRKSTLKGDAVIISVPAEEASLYTHLDGFDFGGKEIRARELSGRLSAGARQSESRRSPAPPGKASFSFKESGTELIKTELKNLLSRRYDPETKVLNLGSLFEEPEVKEILAKPSNTAAKLFSVLCGICEDVFPDKTIRRQSITGLSLGSNNFKSLLPARPIAWEFPDLVNLDLSNNNLQRSSDLNAYLKCTKIEYILLAGNPWLEKPNFKSELLRAFPKLKVVDGVEVTDADREAVKSKHAMPQILPGAYNDSTGIGQTFFQNFFVGFDSDRKALVDYYYDRNSTFSFTVNTRALKDPDSKVQTEKGEWEAWVYRSRNLMKITHAHARDSRKHKGSQRILKEFQEMPPTKHASIQNPSKWMVECFPMTGLADPTGQSKEGVNGMCLVVHGEFEEHPTIAAKRKLRSFDRTFVLGPGGSNPEGIVIVSDLLTVRGYGGTKAFEPDSAAPKSVEEERAVTLAELQRETGMNVQYATMCLEQTDWRLEAAFESWQQAKANIPPEAYV